MNLSAFKPYFSFKEPTLVPKLSYGFTHFYNKARVHIDWECLSVIKKATECSGALILGQMPIYSFRESLVQKLAHNGLVVSCNDHFELAGIGTLCDIIPPHIWGHYKIDHQHLPISGFASKTDPLLIVQTLEKMVDVYDKKGSIYVHCKAGRSRSALITALFLCITDNVIKLQLLQAQTNQEINAILLHAVNHIKMLRSQVSIDQDKLALGVLVLKNYIQFWQGTHYEPRIFALPADLKDQLTAYQALTNIVQSDEYKFVWDQAYKNPAFFSVIKRFAERIFLRIEQSKEPFFVIDQFIASVLNDFNDEESEIIMSLHEFYSANEEFIKELNNYSDSIQSLGLDLLDKIIKSNLSYAKKTDWLKKTSIYLNNPGPAQLEQYNKEIEAALIQPSITLQIIGGAMILLGAAVIMVTMVAGAFASGSFLGVSLAIIGAGAIGAFEMVIGSLVYEHGTSDAIARASDDLLRQVSEWHP
jgi:protein-tyrosine phosphatase